MTEKITLQKIFDLAWQRFIVERAPPAMVMRSCCYKTDDGRRCAVGLAIPDDMIETVRDEGEFSILVDGYPNMFDQSVLETPSSELDYFQSRLHDGHARNGHWVDTIEDLRREYLKVAKDYGLTVPHEQ